MWSVRLIENIRVCFISQWIHTLSAKIYIILFTVTGIQIYIVVTKLTELWVMRRNFTVIPR